MEQQTEAGIPGSKGTVAAKLKKIVKILGITVLCVILLMVAGFGIILFKALRPAAPSASGQTSVTAPQSPDEPVRIDVPTCNEFKLYASKPLEQPICLSDEGYRTIVDSITEQPFGFAMSEYYALDQALALYHSTQVDKRTETTLLTDGLLDVDKLIQSVHRNNEKVMPENRNALNMFYSKLEESDIELICGEICKVVNDLADAFDIDRIANSLECMTMFKREGTTSNAYITTDITFIYNPIMTNNYDLIQNLKGNDSEKSWEMVIDHEIMHLIQYSADDLHKDNGIEIGMSRMYNVPDAEKAIPVDSLFFPWLLEAGAEMGMADYLGVKIGTYEKKVSYAVSYNLSRFYENASRETALEQVQFLHTLEDAFTALGLTSEQEQMNFLKFLFSIEITQSDPEDFWLYYKAQTGRSPSDEEKLAIRMGIRTEVVKYMTCSFFSNLAAAIHDGAIADLDTAFYMLRLWELDTFKHLNYTERTALERAEDFIIWYNQMQTVILTAIAQDNDLDPQQIQAMYSEYCLQLSEEKDNCELSGLTAYTQELILNAKKSYNTSNFSRISHVADWLTP